ncbi:MAG TPA: hypothetical protein VHM48_13880 [Candidatus Limnocylindrales bacterium]|nr:hypothetical protein [Candidatus Limnocylindrales bacterium]
MGFLRRLLGNGDRDGADDSEPAAAEPADAATVDAEERARELELARFDQERVDDLVRRQQRYADRSWTPPAQGGERRADDEDAAGT